MSLIRAWLITAPLIVLATVLLGSVSAIATLADRSGRAPHRIARWWSKFLIFVSGIKVKVEGLERIDPRGTYVIAANHRSLMDPPLLMALLPLEVRFLAKQSLFRIPFIGGHLKRAGHIAVPREDVRGSLKALTAAAQLVRESGISVLVFPEGGRTRGELGQFREGAAYIAIKAQVPVIPIAIAGTGEVLPMGSLTVRPGKVVARVGEPMETKGLSLGDRTVLTEELRRQIEALLSQESGPATTHEQVTRLGQIDKESGS